LLLEPLEDRTVFSITLSLPSDPPTYLDNAPPVVIDPYAQFSDPGTSTFTGGQLVVSLTAGSGDDRLGVRNAGTGTGQVGVAGHDVTLGGTVIGTLSGGESSVPLAVTFNANATQAAIQEVVRYTTFADVSNAPSTAARTVAFQVSDGSGATSAKVNKTVAVQDVTEPLTVVHPVFLSQTPGGNPGLVGSYVNKSLRAYSTQDDWRVSQIIAGTRVDPAINFPQSAWGSRASVGVTGGPVTATGTTFPCSGTASSTSQQPARVCTRPATTAAGCGSTSTTTGSSIPPAPSSSTTTGATGSGQRSARPRCRWRQGRIASASSTRKVQATTRCSSSGTTP
jgi:hypothetical protein